MAVKKKNEEMTETVQSVEHFEFEKEQIIASEKYRSNRDLVDALLEKDKKYTLETVDKMIEKYMKGQVK